MPKVILLALLVWVLWTYLKRPAAAARPRVGEAEARAILGVASDADAEAIRAAHRHLIGAVHPDRGGSVELARRINAARDVLLKRG